ncbi:MAG: isoprenylcysteine carboxylmethyltransferase family protein [Candidatus Aminicenantes bacterium]|nr:isoprenylcysteine carboxylmethyltransferase family protein [Candidatus Aminicenantes bacterium]
MRGIGAFLVLGPVFFLPAGTLRYWQAWVYMAILLIPMTLVMIFFFKKDPERLERRMRWREKEKTQRKIVSLGALPLMAGILIPGFDRRWGWSSVPTALAVFAGVMVVLGYLIFVRVMMENRYLSRIVEVVREQEVVSTGPYAVVRHPMYSGTLLLYLFTPLALGSLWAVIPFALTVIMFPLRILNEEKVLLRDLPGYGEYMEKTRFRLIPGVW